MLSDLRESGSIEQDSDIVMLLHRPDATNPDDPRAGEIEVLVAKQRSGPQARVSLTHRAQFVSFCDLARG